MIKNETIDILAVCKSYGSVQDVTLKNSEVGQKRELIMVDESNIEVLYCADIPDFRFKTIYILGHVNDLGNERRKVSNL